MAHVWEFTNQKKLNKREFIDYFERKVFRTIRKYGMLPKSQIIPLKKSTNLNSVVLRHIIEKKFKIKQINKTRFSDDNMSDVAEEIFANILKGKYIGPKPKDKKLRPLYFLSDEETQLYAKLTNIKGKTKKRNTEVQKIFNTFKPKNPDIEHNVINSFMQI
jgi:hypothetical protein